MKRVPKTRHADMLPERMIKLLRERGTMHKLFIKNELGIRSDTQFHNVLNVLRQRRKCRVYIGYDDGFYRIKSEG